MRSDRVRIAAAKAAVTASKKTGRPVDPRVAMLADSACRTPADMKTMTMNRLAGTSILSLVFAYARKILDNNKGLK